MGIFSKAKLSAKKRQRKRWLARLKGMTAEERIAYKKKYMRDYGRKYRQRPGVMKKLLAANRKWRKGSAYKQWTLKEEVKKKKKINFQRWYRKNQKYYHDPVRMERARIRARKRYLKQRRLK